VQGGSVIKPLVGAANDGPSDAAVLRPVLSSRRGLAIACGLNPRYGDYDTYHMAACAIDEAVRNCVAVGANPARSRSSTISAGGNTDRPENARRAGPRGAGVLRRGRCLWHAVHQRQRQPQQRVQFRSERRKQTIQIPHTLLISALGQIDDVRRCVTMDLKDPGNLLYQVGQTKAELAGSHFELVTGGRRQRSARRWAGAACRCSNRQADIRRAAPGDPTGHVRACHDLSEGGLAVALAEMAFAGGLGARVRLAEVPHDGSADSRSPEADAVLLFSESASRFVIEVPPAKRGPLEALFRQARCHSPTLAK
jgi:phosphoribosylformylglycinamidine synthase